MADIPAVPATTTTSSWGFSDIMGGLSTIWNMVFSWPGIIAIGGGLAAYFGGFMDSLLPDKWKSSAPGAVADAATVAAEEAGKFTKIFTEAVAGRKDVTAAMTEFNALLIADKDKLTGAAAPVVGNAIEAAAKALVSSNVVAADSDVVKALAARATQLKGGMAPAK